jgi:hypothetical protein
MIAPGAKFSFFFHNQNSFATFRLFWLIVILLPYVRASAFLKLTNFNELGFAENFEGFFLQAHELIIMEN